ncbi:MAG: hypothetical protein GY851_30500 [bacterium]|nr:hypothetical protein [bacterium]
MPKQCRRRARVLRAVLALFCAATVAKAETAPFDEQVSEQLARLESPSPTVRAGAAEALGYLRAYSAAGPLTLALGDDSAVVRRETAMALAWCGGRDQVTPLLKALGDEDWVTRQAACVSLANLTGMDFAFDALAPSDVRRRQADRWRGWWADVPADKPPSDVLALVQGAEATKNLALGCAVTASTTYKGPPDVLTDGTQGGDYWQTKNVPFPQHCTVDLGEPRTVGCVTVHQYGTGYCMSDYALATSLDGRVFDEIRRQRTITPAELRISFAPRRARYVRITSFASEQNTYPTTFREIEVSATPPPEGSAILRLELGVRALGALGGHGASQAIHRVLALYVHSENVTSAEETLVQAGLRSLGRLRHPESLLLLVTFLENRQWARYAADALGDYGGADAAAALIAIYPRYGRGLQGQAPKAYPADDWPNLSPSDRMFETPFSIAFALARLPLNDENNRAALRRLAPLLVANLPSDYDAAMIYEPEAHQVITAHLLERVGLRRTACDAVLRALGADVPDRPAGHQPETMALEKLAQQLSKYGKHAVDKAYMEVASWLPTFCRDERDVPLLIAFLEHENGWVRINAAKALMFMEAQEAVAPLSRILMESKPEGAYGYFGGLSNYEGLQGQDEFNDPVPRCREAYIRALGRLGATQCVPVFVEILNDELSAVGIQHAAALVLDELGTDDSLAALEDAEANHPYHSVRLVAREALWRRGAPMRGHTREESTATARTPLAAPALTPPTETSAIVFIKGSNTMPNQFQIDPWRQTYSTTDTGPTYRLGRNLFLLKPAELGGMVTPLTEFEDGFVADCEVSWDGNRVIFARRGGDDDPWWHIWEMNVDGTDLHPITRGPYHDVQPAYLPDGRIVFASSRIGLRDEYHGYLACGLSVMNPDGSDIHCIGFNLGGDREPAVLEDGRIVFSRLELFYSRLKTELIVEAVFPDGTKNVTLYGPERREFWRQATQRAKENWWGEAPPRHRVVRMTQPQPFGEGRVLCASTAGLTVTGPGRYRETVLPHDKNMAITSPYPLWDGRILCAATAKGFERSGQANAKGIDLGLYIMNSETGAMHLLYNDPETAEFEARPVRSRARPPVRPDGPRQHGYTGRLFCSSAFVSQEERVRNRGKLVRIVEGQPVVTRHRTHRSLGGPAWKNHTGTHARVLGTAPLAADGSFYVEVPADRLIHVQVLDSDRRVVGNQQIWMYARPGETRSCVGCHERPDSSPPPRRAGFADTAQVDPVRCLPTGGEFSYRAKFWNKGTLTDEGEERTRTVRAVNLLGRY